MNKQPAGERSVAVDRTYRVKWLTVPALMLIAVYRTMLSPVLAANFGPACRFEPTCSLFAIQAIDHYGIVRGGWMALKRLMRCRPLGGWGCDPLPVAECTDRTG